MIETTMINRLKHAAYGCKKQKDERLMCITCGINAPSIELLSRHCNCGDPLIVSVKSKKSFKRNTNKIKYLIMYIFIAYLVLVCMIKLDIFF